MSTKRTDGPGKERKVCRHGVLLPKVERDLCGTGESEEVGDEHGKKKIKRPLEDT